MSSRGHALDEHALDQMSRYEFSPGRTRVYVWEKPVRAAHWLIFVSLIVLSFTGYYIYNPFIISRSRTAFTMATMRFIHVTAGWVFLIGLLIRIYWFFVGNQWSRINQFIPMSRERWRDIRETGKYYGFLRWNPTAHLGHNAMAGAAYSAIYALAALEVVTGLVLYNNIIHSKWLGFFVNWIPRWIDIQYLRETHFLLMFAFWVFFIHHMYSALLTSSEEKNGCMESIFTGYKFATETDLRREFGDETPYAAAAATRVGAQPVRPATKTGD
jgi:Ni/Fe-hydrogenase 1 B-type cytochrome subunit